MAYEYQSRTGYETSFKGRAYNKAMEIAESDNPAIGWIARGALIVLIGVALKLFVINLTPYLLLIGQDAVEPSGIPILGWLVDVLAALIFCTGATLIWALVNGAQILWLVILADKWAWRGAIATARRDAAATGGNVKGEAYATRRAKRHLSKLPFQFIAWSGYIALGAFAFDLIVNLRAYPPIANWPAFYAGLTIGDFSAIDMGKVLVLALSLFSTEVLAVAIVAVWGWVWTRSQHQQPQV